MEVTAITLTCDDLNDIMIVLERTGPKYLSQERTAKLFRKFARYKMDLITARMIHEKEYED